jgi:hypothetical protein
MCSLSDLAEACEDEEFVVNDMQSNGLKGFKRRPFIKAVNADHPRRNGDAGGLQYETVVFGRRSLGRSG